MRGLACARVTETEWTPPGKGRWELEVSHFGGTFTEAYRDLYQRGQHAGMKASLARYGVPGSHMAVEFVNDRPYMRLVPLVEPPGALGRRTPPAWVLWLLTRFVPWAERVRRVPSFHSHHA